MNKVWMGCDLKLVRAHEHSDLLDHEIMSFNATQPYSVSKRHSDDGLTHSVVVDRVEGLNTLARWSIIVGDCVHNLRSALDHAIYARAILESGLDTPPNERELHFPIFTDKHRFDSSMGKMQCFQSATISLLEAFQPYNKPHQRIANPLSILTDFDNSDKHRLLNIVAVFPQNGRLSLSGSFKHRKVEDIVKNISARSERIEVGAELVVLQLKEPIEDFSFNYEISVGPGLPIQDTLTGGNWTEAAYVISEMTESVKNCIDQIKKITIRQYPPLISHRLILLRRFFHLCRSLDQALIVIA